MMKAYVVYILTNNPLGTLYIGVTNNLKRRMQEHRLGIIDGFTKKYDLKKLVYVEQFQYINNAIAREKQLKRWHREWKVNLITKQNPQWNESRLRPIVATTGRQVQDPPQKDKIKSWILYNTNILII